MVFGWGKKKDSIVDDVIEPVATSSTEITLEEIPQILDDVKNLRGKTLIAEIRSFRIFGFRFNSFSRILNIVGM